MKRILTRKIVCSACGKSVKGLTRGVGGVKVHSGHRNPRLDHLCGVWGWRWKVELA